MNDFLEQLDLSMFLAPVLMENAANADVAAARAAMKARMAGGKKGSPKKSAAVLAAEAEASRRKSSKTKGGFEKKPGLSKLDAGFSH